MTFEEKGGDPAKIRFSKRKVSRIFSLISEDHPFLDVESLHENERKYNKHVASEPKCSENTHRNAPTAPTARRRLHPLHSAPTAPTARRRLHPLHAAPTAPTARRRLHLLHAAPTARCTHCTLHTAPTALCTHTLHPLHSAPTALCQWYHCTHCTLSMVGLFVVQLVCLLFNCCS